LRPRRSRNLRALGISAAIAVGASLGVLAPTALAAPTNDHFGDRTVLPATLPIAVSESNVGATKDPGESHLGNLSASGHSLWWEWEAPASEWVTVSVCESGFLADVDVFEGTELEHLTEITDERTNGDQGPGCWAIGMTHTFAAVAGRHYVIGADGNSFYPPPPPGEPPHVPSGEGMIKLSLEATPPPPNDDFAAATPVGTHFQSMRESPFEEPNEDRYLYEHTVGYNWGATKQPGEPDHAGDPGGASVWYSFTPAESGEARISLQGAGGPKLLALYRGSALGELEPVGSSAGPFSYLTANVVGGAEYRIAVDGSQAVSTAEPFAGSFMGSFELEVNLILPPAAETPPGVCACLSEPLPQVPPPTTPTPAAQTPTPTLALTSAVTIGAHQVDAAAGTATFRFASPTKGASFRCKLDGKAYEACASPFKVKGLRPGRHVLRVLARGKGTKAGAPAVVHFTVAAPHRRHRLAG
jgi:hypothetical protein